MARKRYAPAGGWRITMEPAGIRLRKIRLEKGISLEEVHKKTKIHLNVLRAIEEDSLINFNPVYIRGFLKIYCQFLGLNPRDYVTDYREPSYTVKPSGGKEKRSFSISNQKSSGFSFFKRVRLEKNKILLIAAVIIFVFLLFNLGRLISSRRFSARQRPRVAVLKTVKAEKTGESSAKEQKKAGVNQIRSENSLKADAYPIVRLGIRAKENCWIQLKTDGRVIFEGTLMKGRSESWHAKNKIELTVGNAGAIELEVNGKPIPSLGKRGQKIKGITISKEGLSTGR
jgi:cytoskeletal protein RodZ